MVNLTMAILRFASASTCEGKQKHGPAKGPCPLIVLSIGRRLYDRLRSSPKPAKPAPNNKSVEGSGESLIP